MLEVNHNRTSGGEEGSGVFCVFAVTEFHKMLYGKRFVLPIDHIYSRFPVRKRESPIYTATRVQRWAVTFLLYNFDIQNILSTNFGHANDLLRLMASQSRPDEDYVIAAVHLEVEVRSILEDTLRSLSVTLNTIAAETQKDVTHKKITGFLLNSRPSNVKNPAIKKFYARREGLQLKNNCVTWSSTCDSAMPIRLMQSH